jgi:hypothetical protein
VGRRKNIDEKARLLLQWSIILAVTKCKEPEPDQVEMCRGLKKRNREGSRHLLYTNVSGHTAARLTFLWLQVERRREHYYLSETSRGEYL